MATSTAQGSHAVEVRMEGVRETAKAIRASDAAMKKGIRERLKRVGTIVASEAQSRARARGLVGSGELVRKIRPFATATKVSVKASAKRRSNRYPAGFNYPQIYEYGGANSRAVARKTGSTLSAVRNRSKTAKRLKLGEGATATTGSRAFMAPALAAKKDEAVRAMTKVLEDVGREFGSAQ